MEMQYKGFYNFCPGWVDQNGKNHSAFFCTVPVKIYGLQYVFCCGNLTARYCCRDPDEYYIHKMGGPEPDMAHLVLMQFWPILAMMVFGVVFGLAVMCTRSPNNMRRAPPPPHRVSPEQSSSVVSTQLSQYTNKTQ